MALSLIRGGAALGAVILLGVGSASVVGRIRSRNGFTREPTEAEVDLTTPDPFGLHVEGEGDARIRAEGPDWDPNKS